MDDIASKFEIYVSFIEGEWKLDHIMKLNVTFDVIRGENVHVHVGSDSFD